MLLQYKITSGHNKDHCQYEEDECWRLSLFMGRNMRNNIGRYFTVLCVRNGTILCTSYDVNFALCVSLPSVL